MWSRAPEVRVGSGALALATLRPPADGWRFRAGLLRWPADSAASDPATVHVLTSVAWEDPAGAIRWGWGDDTGVVALHEAAAPPDVCAALPPAVALALALRRADVDPGARCVVVGTGYGAALASAVAATAGLRVRSVPASHNSGAVGPEDRPSIVIQTTTTRGALAGALAHCADWGTVFDFGSTLEREPLDYYADIHRRALSLHRVPFVPRLAAGESAVVDRGVSGLIEALHGLRFAAPETLSLQGLPPGQSGMAVRDAAGDWCLLRA